MSLLDWVAPKSDKLPPWHGWRGTRFRTRMEYGYLRLHPPMWLHIDRHYMAGEHYLRIFVGRVVFISKLRRRRPGE